MVLLEFAIFPTDKGESVSQYVAEIISIIDKSGVNYQLTPMGTILEGDWDSVISVVGLCFKHLERKSNRINLNLKVDFRKGDALRMEKKVDKIKSILNKK